MARVSLVGDSEQGYRESFAWLALRAYSRDRTAAP